MPNSCVFPLAISPALPVSRPFLITTGGHKNHLPRLVEFYWHQNLTVVAKSSPENDGIVAADNDNEDGWANSLCQGANLPLPVPLKIDKIPGGVRLGFITIGDGKTEVLVYIDCLVFPATGGSGPIFRAIRNGPLKDKSPPGEPRIMRSLLQALQKSVEIAGV
ncbi:hypothetical protein GH714_038093 [Hevea brasiliensis]|uniref:DUF7148 domain-containing protein n=1 Tax=Hevea brasiliensis TaxID=3981 RepID=A0A6A6KN66_HEVBR|nr:hypothetical protein GH714_038093 [Hevea brasiliensis]